MGMGQIRAGSCTLLPVLGKGTLGYVSFVQVHGLPPVPGAILGHEKIWNLTWKKYAHPLPRVYAIFLFAIEYSAKTQPPQHTTMGACAPGVAPSPHRACPVVVYRRG